MKSGKIDRRKQRACVAGCVPVVHEHVGFPDAVRGDPKVLDAAILRRVPPQVDIVPLLPCGHDARQ
jgi:hypothetical protein